MKTDKEKAKEVMKGNLKLHAFPEFPYEELKPILEFIEKQGFKITFIDNGNIVCQKIPSSDEVRT